MKIKKGVMYKVKFVHCLDCDDIISECIEGKALIRLKGMMLDLGYELKEIKEINK